MKERKKKKKNAWPQVSGKVWSTAYDQLVWNRVSWSRPRFPISKCVHYFGKLSPKGHKWADIAFVCTKSGTVPMRAHEGACLCFTPWQHVPKCVSTIHRFHQSRTREVSPSIHERCGLNTTEPTTHCQDGDGDSVTETTAELDNKVTASKWVVLIFTLHVPVLNSAGLAELHYHSADPIKNQTNYGLSRSESFFIHGICHCWNPKPYNITNYSSNSTRNGPNLKDRNEIITYSHVLSSVSLLNFSSWIA